MIGLLRLATFLVLLAGSAMLAFAVRVGAALGAHVLLPWWLCLVIAVLAVFGTAWMVAGEIGELGPFHDLDDPEERA